MEGENTMKKRLSVFPAHSRILLWRSKVIWLLKSLRHRCQKVRQPKQPILQKLIFSAEVVHMWHSGVVRGL